MTQDRAPRPRGAVRQTEFPANGDQKLRLEWKARATALMKLEDAVTALVDWRERNTSGSIVSGDARWIETRLEERVAVLRFDELTHEEIRSRTLTGDLVNDVAAAYLQRAESAAVVELEQIAAEFRRRYKPPIMPSSAYLRIEVILSEFLMKRRSLGWFDPSLTELRQKRGAKVLKEGLTYQPL